MMVVGASGTLAVQRALNRRAAARGASAPALRPSPPSAVFSEVRPRRNGRPPASSIATLPITCCAVRVRSLRPLPRKLSGPAEDRREPVPEPGQERQVDEQPHQPPQEAGHADSLEADHRPEARDRGHAAQVAVAKRRRASSPSRRRLIVLDGVDALLHGHLGDAGQAVERRHVADREHLRVARAASSRAGPRRGRPGRSRRRSRPRASWRAAMPGRPRPRSWCVRRRAGPRRPGP